jgi:hypothetical protein
MANPPEVRVRVGVEPAGGTIAAGVEFVKSYNPNAPLVEWRQVSAWDSAPFFMGTLPADLFTAISAPVFSLVWPAAAPVGPYTVALVFTPVGAFSDSRVNPTAGIIVAVSSFTAAP